MLILRSFRKGQVARSARQITLEVAMQPKTEGPEEIHKADGTLEEERTYPRSADPRRSKG
ncbi:hypothetical protein AS889_10705 [Pseudomonas putida]|nr:hypothetical protein AS889_10705 [Pseudomonas putida]